MDKVILHNQFPANCSHARKLVCDINKYCGFGCQMHHVLHCLANAVALNRTMILKVTAMYGEGSAVRNESHTCPDLPHTYLLLPHQTRPWRYLPGEIAWEDVFMTTGKCSLSDQEAILLQMPTIKRRVQSSRFPQSHGKPHIFTLSQQWQWRVLP